MQHRIAALLYALALSACEPIADDPATPSPQPQAPDVTGSKQPAPEGGPATMPAPPVVSIKRLDGTGNLRAVTDEVKVSPTSPQQLANPSATGANSYKNFDIQCLEGSAGNTYKIDFTVTDSFGAANEHASDTKTLTVTCNGCNDSNPCATSDFCNASKQTCEACPPTCGGNCDGKTTCTACNDGWYGGHCENACGTVSGSHCKADDTSTDPDTHYYACDKNKTTVRNWHCTECAAGWHSTTSNKECKAACANKNGTNCTDTALETAICDRDSSGTQTYDGNILSCEGCVDGWYSQKCNFSCKQPTGSQHCSTEGGTRHYQCKQYADDDHTDWQCTACAAGWHNTTSQKDCSTACTNSTGTSGPHCAAPNNATCDRNSNGQQTTDGTIINCNGLCSTGYYGITCNTPCANSTTTSGPHCATPTAATCDRNSSNQLTTDGTITNCNGACIDGWYDADCDQSCRAHNTSNIVHCTDAATVTCDQNGGGNPVCSACNTGYYNGAHTNCTDECPNTASQGHCSDSAHTVCNISSGNTISCTACDNHYYNAGSDNKCSTACSSLIQTGINHCSNSANATCTSNSTLKCNGCESTAYTGDKCDACASNYYRKPGTGSTFTCVSSCGDGYYQNSGNHTCTACTVSNCKTCSPATQCTACTGGLVPNDDGTACVEQPPSNP